MKLRNLGVPYRRQNNEVVPMGGTFEPSDKELGSIEAQYQIGIRFAVVVEEPERPSAPPPVEPETGIEDEPAVIGAGLGENPRVLEVPVMPPAAPKPKKKPGRGRK